MFKVSRREALALTAGVMFAGDAEAKNGAIDEAGFVSIGGIDQWVAIQGRSRTNQVVLFLHGGPAEAESPFLQEFRPWEPAFTVVNWDQRGAGKTYGKNGPSTPGMTIERMADDAIEVAEHVRRRLGKSKVILVGHSWGAILGLHAIKRRPELFHAFVGTGQPVSWALTVNGQEAWARQQATTAGDQATLKALDQAAGLPLTDWRHMVAAAKYRMSPSDIAYLDIQKQFIGPPPYPTSGDVADWIAGGAFTASKLGPTLLAFDARALGLDMPIPFFVIQGRDDHVAPVEAARAYVHDVRAPAKAFVLIDGGHFALFTNPDGFVAALRRCVSRAAG
jgi:pimeloyl-ACP methyl ester carboxylesterase